MSRVIDCPLDGYDVERLKVLVEDRERKCMVIREEMGRNDTIDDSIQYWYGLRQRLTLMEDRILCKSTPASGLPLV
jgi:hypothetical protein